ncbi:MAG: hypothetical protein WCP31_10815 [Chloroflexales bacterium]
MKIQPYAATAKLCAAGGSAWARSALIMGACLAGMATALAGEVQPLMVQRGAWMTV